MEYRWGRIRDEAMMVTARLVTIVGCSAIAFVISTVGVLSAISILNFYGFHDAFRDNLAGFIPFGMGLFVAILMIKTTDG